LNLAWSVHISCTSEFQKKQAYRSFVEKDFEMLTRKQNAPTAGLAIGLLAGMLSQLTAATEEVVVNGKEAAAQAQAQEVRFQTEMKDYAQSLNEDLKTRLNSDMKKLPAPQVRLAIGEIPTRG
jgi:hypothetical protein